MLRLPLSEALKGSKMRKFFGKAAILSILVMLVGGAFAQAEEELTPTVTYTLEAKMGSYENGPFGYVGVGGDIDGVANPALTAKVGDVVEVILINGDPMAHDFVIPDLDVATEHVENQGDEVRVVFTVTEAGEFRYLCSLPGHEAGGMWGIFTVTE